MSSAADDRQAAERTSDRVGNVRLVLAVLALGLILAPTVVRSPAPWWGLIPIFAGFVLLGWAQDRALDRRRRAAATERFFREGLARVEGRLDELPEVADDVGAPWRGTLHYADDLALIGSTSLFRLVCRAEPVRGRQLLAKDLCEPPDAAGTRARRQAREELEPQLDFRVRLVASVAGDDARRLDETPLLDWARGRTPIPNAWLLWILATVQPLILLATFIVYQVAAEGRPLFVAVVLQLATLFLTRNVVGSRTAVLSGPERMLARYARLLEAVEGHAATSPWLGDVKSSLSENGSAARAVNRLVSLINLLDAQLNVIFALTVGPALLWNLNLVLRTEQWRERHGAAVDDWFEAIARFEVASSWAGLAFERPAYGSLELTEAVQFDAESLAHPLIFPDAVVANDLRLAEPGATLLLSGSNMSGKSTLLRSVGLALVMGRAGGPVAARALRAFPFELVTSVRVVDSLAQGTSHFYAELKRLKHVVDRSSTVGSGLLYLLDEILHGTNSRERFVGAVSVVRWLSRNGSIGIVTTHDLSLARLSDELPEGTMVQMHMSDRVDSEAIEFDYELRPGPIQSTNALRLMKAIGIDVDLIDESRTDG